MRGMNLPPPKLLPRAKLCLGCARPLPPMGRSLCRGCGRKPAEERPRAKMTLVEWTLRCSEVRESLRA